MENDWADRPGESMETNAQRKGLTLDISTDSLHISIWVHIRGQVFQISVLIDSPILLPAFH